ncbi:MAG: beta-hydroxyacyl-ACP dehydratase [Planctomyces sp.]|nr:beta-hydroxyacyl-ACP dehydratase [Planctomyces sp.]
MNREQIEQCIPHREPFLWLDEVTELTERSISARKHLRPDLDVFRGHYPDFPLLPGVLQCEAMFQAAAILISRLLPVGEDAAPVVTRLSNGQFRRMVRPGETLTIDVELVERVSKAFYLKGRTSVDGRVTARIEFACTEAPRAG